MIRGTLVIRGNPGDSVTEDHLLFSVSLYSKLVFTERRLKIICVSSNKLYMSLAFLTINWYSKDDKTINKWDFWVMVSNTISGCEADSQCMSEREAWGSG